MVAVALNLPGSHVNPQCLYICIDGVISSSHTPPLAFPSLPFSSVCGSLSDPTAVICSGLNHKSQVKINFTNWIISLPKLQMVLTLWDASGCWGFWSVFSRVYYSEWTWVTGERKPIGGNHMSMCSKALNKNHFTMYARQCSGQKRKWVLSKGRTNQ